jgi:hypothetical protein
MGMTDLPAVGSKMTIMAEVTVTSISQRQDQKDVCQTVDMQMTSLGVEPKAEPGVASRVFANSNMAP